MLSEMKDLPPAKGQQPAATESTIVTVAAPLVTSAPATPQLSSAEAPQSAVMSTGSKTSRDSSWLELEACREHLRQNCPRSAEECRFAHPEPRILVKDGKVTCCYDFLKDRCHREKCRYFHPPAHIKERLVSAGKTFGAMMSNLHLIHTGSYPGTLPPASVAHELQYLLTQMMPPSVPVVAPLICGPGGRVMSAAPPGFVPGPPYAAVNDRIEICPDFVQGRCNSPMCSLVHPEPHVRRNLDSTVTVCRDFLRGGCSREQCRYFHPSGNLLATLESSAMLQQGMMVASPVMSMYPPVVYPIPGPVSSIPSPDATSIPTSGVPIYSPMPVPSVAGPVPVPLALAPPGVVHLPAAGQVPISTITSAIQMVSNGTATPKGVSMPSPQNIIMAPAQYEH